MQRAREQQQQQQRHSRRGPGIRDGRYDDDDDGDDDDDPFMDPKEAARLRRLVKQRGLAAVVDEAGFVRVPVDGDDREGRGPPASARHGRAASDRRNEHDVNHADDDDDDDNDDGGGGGGGHSRGRRLFSQAHLQAAAPRGAALAAAGVSGAASSTRDLPVVRPAGSTTSEEGGGGRAAAFFSGRSWAAVGASDAVVAALAELGVTRPSHVQTAAYGALLPSNGPRHIALADQAGSGKTLAYLLPLLQALKSREAATGRPATKPGSPSVIVMTPTSGAGQAWVAHTEHHSEYPARQLHRSTLGPPTHYGQLVWCCPRF